MRSKQIYCMAYNLLQHCKCTNIIQSDLVNLKLKGRAKKFQLFKDSTTQDNYRGWGKVRSIDDFVSKSWR